MDAALVFNCGHNGLSIIRELGRQGVNEIYALDSVRSIGTHSRYARFSRCPDPLTNETAFIEFLLRFAKGRTDKPVLFPTNDHWAQAIAHHKDVLNHHYRMWVADGPVVDLLIQKPRFYEWAMKQGYPVPRSWSDAEVAKISNDCFPIIAKPAFRVASSDSKLQATRAVENYRKRLTVLETREQLEVYRRGNTSKSEECVFQEYVRGLSDCMYTVGVYVNQEHEVMGVFTGRKVRGFPPDIGDCIVGQVEKIDEAIVCMVKHMCRDLRYSGIAEFEFKKDSVTGKMILIEVNPRSWSWIGITPSCGVSLPWMAYCDMTGHKSISYTETTCQTGSVKYAKVSRDRRNCLRNNRRSGYTEWHMTHEQWKQSLECDILVDAEYSLDDMKPWLFASWRKSFPVSIYGRVKSRIRRITTRKKALGQ